MLLRVAVVILVCGAIVAAYFVGRSQGYREGFQIGQMHTISVLFGNGKE